MIIKNKTGRIFLSNSDIPIAPELTREQFLTSSLSQSAEIWVQNEPSCSYRLAPVETANTRFYIVLQFHSQKLKRVTLADAHPRFGTSWDDVTEEKLIHRKAEHDKWLKVWNLLSGSYSWGSVANSIDPHNNTSSLIFSYV